MLRFLLIDDVQAALTAHKLIIRADFFYAWFDLHAAFSRVIG